MDARTDRTRDWRWLRAYYFEPSKDSLILDGIWPAVTHVCRDAGGGPAAYFQRDWLGGPNVLLGVKTIASDRDVHEIAQAIRAFMADHPSSTGLSTEEISRRTESLRVQEHRLGMVPLAPQPNNSVRIETGEPYSPFLTDDALKEAVRTFLGRSSEFAVDWLQEIRADSLGRQHICLTVMIALAWLADPELLRSHGSFSSHAHAFLRVQDRDGYLARLFATKYEGPDGEKVRRLLRETTDSFRSGSGSDSGRGLPARMAGFVDLLRETMTDIYAGLRTGRYQPVPAATLVGNPDRGTVNYSRLIELLDAEPALRAWQITISLVYQLLNQLGMHAADRFLACYVLSRAAEDVFDQPAATIQRNLNATGDPRALFTFFANLDAASSASA